MDCLSLLEQRGDIYNIRFVISIKTSKLISTLTPVSRSPQSPTNTNNNYHNYYLITFFSFSGAYRHIITSALNVRFSQVKRKGDLVELIGGTIAIDLLQQGQAKKHIDNDYRVSAIVNNASEVHNNNDDGNKNKNKRLDSKVEELILDGQMGALVGSLVQTQETLERKHRSISSEREHEHEQEHCKATAATAIEVGEVGEEEGIQLFFSLCTSSYATSFVDHLLQCTE